LHIDLISLDARSYYKEASRLVVSIQRGGSIATARKSR